MIKKNTWAASEMISYSSPEMNEFSTENDYVLGLD